MSGFSAKANELLVEIYRNVQILEQNELKKQRLNISINEMHMIELIAKGKTGMTAVSYTHLDVYKRQEIHSGASGICFDVKSGIV